MSAEVEGEPILQAALDAARTRFRPILMTSFAFILGVLPLVTATGAGANSRISLGLSVFSGMIASTCLAVMFVPSFFVVLQRFEERRKSRSRTRQAGCHRRIVRNRCMLSMKDKVAIVTGAGSIGPGWGNGKATATLLARQGASVFLVDINEAAAQRDAADHRRRGWHLRRASCDMTDRGGVQEMVQACLDRFKRIDILVNNVGGSAPGDPVSMTEEVWDQQIDTNLKTVFLGL